MRVVTITMPRYTSAKAVALDPEETLALDYLAQTYGIQGKYQKALQTFQKGN